MNDTEVIKHIDALVAEEHTLRQHGEGGPLNDEQQARLRSLEVALDQCWDLLRQRRARREFGQDPDDAKPRDASTVERYRQ